MLQRTLSIIKPDAVRNGAAGAILAEINKAGFRLDARTRDGEIQSDFPGLKIDNGEHEATASGIVGNAASHIVINNEHDGIEIRKASSSATPASAPAPPATPAKPAKALPAPKAKVEPTEN